ncbi:phage tail tape measure protein [Deinococcus humi]|uniref:TP901 family phage tail tape measure protein n=1 Tax=Deinococcus humi TaxID=662880 RepID=A0A7W8NCH6_9DEIO|nr:phage tail tape measure protein [Deinococcus humi]MBB5361321.1 TP901 family phage tail tape measure protein [Deinococcus humi]GGO19469.1 hypothetical protein GCM10008949_03860 [Deinococcus humi]
MTTLGRLVFDIDGNRTLLDQKLAQARAEVGKQPLKLALVIDETASKATLQRSIAQLQRQDIQLKVKLDMATATTELRNLRISTVTVNLKVNGVQSAANDINTLKALLSGLTGRTQYVLTVNTTALQAVYTNINAQITALQSLIAQLRALGNSGGPGGGGAGGQGGISAANRQLLNDLQALNNQWKRGEIDAAAFGASLSSLQAQLRTAASGAQAGTADFRALDAGLTRLTTSLRSINTDAFQKIRTDAAAMRTAFDTATAGVSRNSQQFQAAIATYTTASTTLQARLQALVASGQLTTTQLGQVNRELARLGREANTIAGGINAGGLSGNIFNALRMGFPIIGQMGGALGAAAGQANMFGSAIGSAAAAFGPLGIAIGVTTVAVGLLTAGIMSAVNEYGKFEAQMQGVKAVSDATGETFKGLKDQAKSLALEFGLNVNQIGQVQEELFKAGRGVEDVMGGAAKAVTVLMRATGSDLNNAVLIAGAAMNTFNIQGANMMRVADAIANGANKTALDVNTMGVSLQQVGNVASNAGMSLEETVAVLGLMADRGIRGSDAGTSVRVMLQRLTSSMPVVIEALDKYNIKVFDGTGAQRDMVTVLGEVISQMDKMTEEDRAAFLYKVAGTDAQRVLTASYKAGTSSIADYIAKMDDRGRAERDAKTRMEGLQGAQAKLNTTFQIFKDTIGEVFAPAITTLVEAATSGVSALIDLFKMLDNLDKRSAEVEKTALGKELETLQKQLAAEKGEMTRLQSTADAQKRFSGSVSAPIQTRLENQAEKVAGLEAQVKVLELQVRTESIKNGTFVGPVLPGQDDGASGLALTASGADALGAMVVEASKGKLGDVTADSIVNFCAKWVRLTLDKAAPEAEAKINALFQTDSNADGKVEATDAARNLLKAGFAQRYNPKDLKPGDVVFYTEGGQNHTGVYIGKKDGVDMVRGNNRVTYEANGGKFDKYGNAISPGINPVGDVAINKLGTPNWIVRPGDMLPALGVNPPKDKPVKPQGQEDGIFTADQVIKAQQLVAALGKAEKALKDKPGDVWLTKVLGKATADMKAFGDASDGNAAALAAVQKGLGGVKRGADDYIATQADLKKYGDDALKLIKEQERAAKSGNAEAIRVAKANMDTWQGENKAKAAVVQIEQAAYQSRKAAATQAEQDAKKQEAREKELQQLSTQIAADAAAGREREARRGLDTLKQSQAERLELAQDDAAKRQAIITQTGPQIIAAEETINRRVREQAVRAAQQTANERKKVEGADTAAIEQARRTAVAEAYRVEKQANEAARAEQNKAERGAARTVAQEQKQLAQELAGLKIDAAKSTSARLKSIADEDVRAHEGDLKKQLALTKLYSQQEFDRQEKIARATRNLAYQDAAGKPNEQALREKAQAQYLETVENARTARLNTMRTATEAAKKGQEEFNQALADGVKAGNEALGTLDKLNLGGRDLATTAQAASSTRAQYDTLYNRIVILRDELAEPGVADAWAQSIEDMGKTGALSAIQVQTLLSILKDLNGARDVQLLDNLQGRGVKNTARFDDPSQGTLAPGEADRLLEAMMGIDPEELGSILADLVAKGFGDSDLARLIRGHIVDMNFEDLAQMVTDQGGPRFQTDNELRGIGVATDTTIESFFNLEEAIQNAGKMTRDELGEMIRLSRLGADEALKLWDAWNSANPVDLGKQLEGIMTAQSLMDRLEAASDPVQIQAITGEIAEFLASDMGKMLPDGVRQGLTDGVEGAKEYAGILTGITADAITDGWERASKAGGPVENVFQDYAAQIMGGAFDLSDSETLRGLNEGLEDAYQKGKLTASQLDTLKVIIDSINNAPLLITGKDSGTAGLENTIGAITSKIDEAHASYESGASDADAYNAALIEQEAALLRLLVNLERLGPAGAAGAASVRLLLDATTASIDPTKRLADEVGTLAQEKAADLAQSAIKLSQGLREGTVTQQEFNASALDMLPLLDRLGVSLADGSEEGDKAAATIRAIARDLRDMGAATAEAQSKLDKLGEGFQKLSTGLSSVFKAFGADGAGAIVDGLGSIVAAASKVPGELDKVRDSWAAFKKGPDAGSLGTLLGSLGGVVGIAGAVIGAVGSIGDALLKNNPAVKAQVKAWLELADAERAAMGQRMVGGRNGFLNPFYDALKADSEALTTKANAGFWQRLGWSLFGGAPETLGKEASESLQKASAIFNEFGADLFSNLSNVLLDAVNKNDFSGVNDALKLQLDKFVQRAVIDALIAKSNLGPLIKELAETSAAGGDITDVVGRINAEENRIVGQVQAVAPSLPGVGAGAATGANGAPGGALFGAGPGAQLGIPRFEISLPEIALRGLSDFTSLAVPEFRAGTSELRLAVAEWRAFMTGQRGGPPPLSGLGGLT